VLLRREGWAVKAERICRLYTEDGLGSGAGCRRAIFLRRLEPRDPSSGGLETYSHAELRISRNGALAASPDAVRAPEPFAPRR
jgi:hypothetical protein